MNESDHTTVGSTLTQRVRQRRSRPRSPSEAGIDLLQLCPHVTEQEALVLAQARAILLKLAAATPGAVLGSPRLVGEYLKTLLTSQQREVFVMVSLDNRHRVIASDVLFAGTIDGASVHPREVVKCALRRNAAAVIFAHDHPSGVLEPSQADDLITRRLRDALSLVDVRVLDHFIVGEGDCYSFSEQGRL